MLLDLVDVVSRTALLNLHLVYTQRRDLLSLQRPSCSDNGLFTWQQGLRRSALSLSPMNSFLGLAV
jgi:hypothetical protein